MRALLRERIVIDEAGLGNIWPLFYDTELFNRIVSELAVPFKGEVTKIAGIESRGFLLGAAVAARLEVGFVAIRKSEGLYPGPTFDARSSSDYRGHMHTFRIQQASVSSADHVGLVDDWFETGSQAVIAKGLIEQFDYLHNEKFDDAEWFAAEWGEELTRLESNGPWSLEDEDLRQMVAELTLLRAHE
jgi:adenine phosphoribosyltransferase